MNSATCCLCLIWLSSSSSPVWRRWWSWSFKCQCSPLWIQPFSSAFFIIPQHSSHHGLCAHAKLPATLPPAHVHLQLAAHRGVAYPAFLDGKYLAMTSSETLLCAAEWRECCASAADALLTEARHCVSACCQLFSGKVANVCLKSCQKLSYDIID